MDYEAVPVISDKKRLFADNYILSKFSARKAAQLSDIDERTARDWVTDPTVRQYLDAMLTEFREHAIYAIPELGRKLLALALTDPSPVFDALLSDQPIENIKKLNKDQKGLIQEISYDRQGRPQVKLKNQHAAIELAFKVMDAQTSQYLQENKGNTFNFQLILNDKPKGEVINVTPIQGTEGQGGESGVETGQH